jgi:hypothetical protein
MKKGFWAVLCTGIVGANVGTATATPFEFSPGYGWTTFNFVGQELSSGQNVNGFFSFVTSSPLNEFTSPVSVSPGGGSASFNVDRFFVAEASLNYADGRFMNTPSREIARRPSARRSAGSSIAARPAARRWLPTSLSRWART